MSLSQELEARGFIHQFSAPTLQEIVDGEKRTIYHGIDPTADSAHVGNMTVWMLLRHLALHGHTIVFLVGGGTGMIGDPKPDAERQLKTIEEVDANVQKVKAQAEVFFAGLSVEFVNNYEWLSKLTLIDFLRDTGKHFTVNELIKKDAISTRLQSEVGLSYTEFAYPILQGFDYLQLHQQYNCTLQVGGSDQWGNMVTGIDLIRRKTGNTVHVVTTPLIVDKATGKKFGKSEGNAVWLDAEKTSPYQFYQFWFNVSDESVIDYLKLYTFLSLSDIEVIERDFSMNPGARSAQKKLAYEVTKIVHGEEAALSAQHVSGILFGTENISTISETEKDILLANAPTTRVGEGESLVEVLVKTELATSKREARTFIESGAVSLNNEKVTDVEMCVGEEVFLSGIALLRRGKKLLHVLVKVS
jgi:tyrosyl-tRNA synthetase